MDKLAVIAAAVALVAIGTYGAMEIPKENLPLYIGMIEKAQAGLFGLATGSALTYAGFKAKEQKEGGKKADNERSGRDR